MGKKEKLTIAIIGLLAAAIGAWKAFDYFIQNGVALILLQDTLL
jgi:hypothetical protein